jgi:2-oxoglutarate dehydrogenase E2 component (dihydrolipoamide succinyltransferase)
VAASPRKTSSRIIDRCRDAGARAGSAGRHPAAAAAADTLVEVPHGPVERARRKACTHDAHARPHRRAPARGDAADGDADDLQRGQHGAGHGPAPKYKDQFEKTHNGTRLGFMGFFVKAACEALKRYPAVNASIDGNDVVYHGYQDIGVAVSTENGLVVPVLRDADFMSLADVEAAIVDLGTRAQEARSSRSRT